MSLFCPKCGSILTPKKRGGNEKGKPSMTCGKCGYISKEIGSKITEKLDRKQKIDVVEKKENVLPLTSAECPKCGNNTAYYWLLQTRAGDEPETKFLKCEKCEHTWRDYS